jgi:hypothetical protein
VVIVDNGLYVGQRLALRDLGEKLARQAPTVVHTPNHPLGRSPPPG